MEPLFSSDSVEEAALQVSCISCESNILTWREQVLTNWLVWQMNIWLSACPLSFFSWMVQIGPSIASFDRQMKSQYSSTTNYIEYT